MITHERLKELLDYDPVTGHFTWRVQLSPRGKVGARAGCYDKSSRSYRVRIDGRNYGAVKLGIFYEAGLWETRRVYGSGRSRDVMSAKPVGLLTQEVLKKLLDYAPETGRFTWRVKPSAGVEVGAEAGTLDPAGYRFIGIGGKRYAAHRLVFLYQDGALPGPGLVVGHTKGRTDDNRRASLSLITKAENARDLRRYSNNKTGHTGVTYRKRTPGDTKVWAASIQANGIRKYLGRFGTKDEAVIARKRAEDENGFHPDHGGRVAPQPTELALRRRAAANRLRQVRHLVFARDGHACLRCRTNSDLCADHITPVAKGGTDELDNLQTLCRTCNLSKGAKIEACTHRGEGA